jgi:hypothetical protein
VIAISESAQVDVPAAHLWGVVEDYALDVRWRSGIVQMTPNPPGPPAVGSKIHEVTRSAGRTYVTDTIIESVGPGYEYRFSGSGDSGGVNGGRSVVPITDGSAKFTYDVELGLSGVLRLAKPLVRTIMRRTLRRDLAALKTLIEEGELTPSPPADD